MDVHQSSKLRRRDRSSLPAPWSLRLAARMPGLSSWGGGFDSRRLYQLMRTVRRPARVLSLGVLGSTPRSAAIPMPPARKRLSYGCQAGSAPAFGTMLDMLDGKGRRDCESRAAGSIPASSTNYRCALGAGRSPKLRQQGSIPCTGARRRLCCARQVDNLAGDASVKRKPAREVILPRRVFCCLAVSV